jgi:hypothetical protein
MLWKSEQQHGTAGTIRFRLNPVTLMPHFLSPSFLFNPDSQLNDCVTASALHFQMRGWILAERTLCSKGKFKGGKGASHRRFTAFPQDANHFKTRLLSAFGEVFRQIIPNRHQSCLFWSSLNLHLLCTLTKILKIYKPKKHYYIITNA